MKILTITQTSSIDNNLIEHQWYKMYTLIHTSTHSLQLIKVEHRLVSTKDERSHNLHTDNQQDD